MLMNGTKGIHPEVKNAFFLAHVIHPPNWRDCTAFAQLPQLASNLKPEMLHLI